MWSIASHAGAGVAIAGLSATYYALARKNYQLERDTGMRGGRSDADQGNIRTSRDDMISISTSQSLLLKKELSHLSRGSGHAIGLNVVDCHGEPPATVLSDSRMNVRQIVSRGQISFPKNALSLHDLDNDQDHIAVSTDIKLESLLTDPIHNSFNQNNNGSRNIFDEEFSQLEMSEEDSKEDSQEHQEIKCAAASGLLSQTNPRTPKICRCILSKESTNKRRTTSPIIYYKNPGFGKRFACKIQESTEFPGIPLPGGNLSKDIKDDDRNRTSEQNYKDSTLFLFPPVLSESKLSVYEDEQGEEMLDEDTKISFDHPIDDMDAVTLVTEGLSRMDEIRDYNLQLQVLQDARNVADQAFFAQAVQAPTLDIVTKSDDESSDLSQSLFPRTTSVPTDSDDKYFSIEVKHMEETTKCESLVETLSLTSTRSFAMREIPAGSWISLPARLYAESEQIPANVMIFLALIVILFGLMGKLFFSISGWIAAPINDEEEFNPSAMLEH